jgi:quinol monooxygenase YgiN
MISEYIRYNIDSSRAVEFVSAYETASENLRASSHCLGYDLSRCVEAPDKFILHILWDSVEGHMKGFRPSAEFKPFLEAIRPYIGDIEEMRHYEHTSVRWTR